MMGLMPELEQPLVLGEFAIGAFLPNLIPLPFHGWRETSIPDSLLLKPFANVAD